jgi:uncharacterized glyoxalase superfamily protein PhnB
MNATVSTSLMYRDAPRAIDWLCNAFGFSRHAVYPDGKGGIAHAELTYGNGMIMLGSWYGATDGWEKLVAPPEAGRANTASINVIVANADEHFARATKAGATIVQPLEDKSYGGRGYGARDLEGHIWSFGTYDPWAIAQSAIAGEQRPAAKRTE